ncbi:enhanced serine sensitivity protein SseB C-terminal domain-containing protein [Pseudomonas sp. AA-38]|uniref:enhanced serine sensitivity protein SseB C-terminal domain-containing protein n=1 Tax=Pseudomonas sp. AA-38 TaxID=3028807 RepID=UPI0023F68D36|nr:enhanced serine sensitivity protein SseB C-terminal domain-containing protein [Pseudomonas sp. AA-38]
MSSTSSSTHYADSPDLAVAPLRHPTLEQALSSACAQLKVRQAYLAALRDPAIGPQPRLLLAVSGADVQGQRRLAAQVAELLPDEVELDLIELSEDNLSRAVRERCQPFYSA